MTFQAIEIAERVILTHFSCLCAQLPCQICYAMKGQLTSGFSEIHELTSFHLWTSETLNKAEEMFQLLPVSRY